MRNLNTIVWMLIIIALYAVGCHFTSSGFSVVPAIVGMIFAIRRKLAYAFSCILLLVFDVIANPILIPKSNVLFVFSVRLGTVAIAMLIILVSVVRRRGKGLNFGFLMFYLLCATISSIGGYFPAISYIKIVNFGIFAAALWLGGKNMSADIVDVMKMRDFIVAFGLFIVASSIVLIPFPAYSYLSALDVMRETGDASAAAETLSELGFFGNALFCGITYQSQALGPLLALVIVYVILDMFLVQRNGSGWHVGALICAAPLLYMTRARVGLVAAIGGIGHFCLLAFRSMSMTKRVRSHVQRSMTTGCIGVAVVLICAEVHSGAISRFIRKRDDVASDARTVSEAFTESRMGAVEMNMHDFKRNPLIGSGFQVWEMHRYAERSGVLSYFSAPIEKGVLPLMVLGEGGILGAVVFMCFCVSFYVGCAKNKLVATPSMMTAFLMSNLGEATFFSPGAVGGVLWILSVLGGYSIDLIAKYDEGRGIPWQGGGCA